MPAPINDLTGDYRRLKFRIVRNSLIRLVLKIKNQPGTIVICVDESCFDANISQIALRKNDYTVH